MNYRHLEIFVTVLDCGSLTAGAEKLGLSQPAVSKSLKLLEAELGVRLILRGGRGLRATDEGRTLYLEAARVTASYEHLEGVARGLVRMEHGRLQISCIPALSADWMPRKIQGFLADYPEAFLSFRSLSSPDTLEGVARGELDLGIAQAGLKDRTVEKTLLFELQAVCVLPNGHPLCRRAAIGLQDLEGERIVSLSARDVLRKGLEAEMRKRGLGFDSRMEVALGVMLCKMIAVGRGIGVVDAESARLHDPDRTTVRPLDFPLTMPVYLLQNALRPQSLMARKFADHLIAESAAQRRAAPRAAGDGSRAD